MEPFPKDQLGRNIYSGRPIQGFDSKALKRGDPWPEVKPGVLRLYASRFSPFCQRTIMHLLRKNYVDFDVVNVDLSEKPGWLIDRNPLGKVPVLERSEDHFIVFESDVCAEWVERTYFDHEFVPRDCNVRAAHRMLLARLEPLLDAVRGLIFSREDDKIEAWSDALDLAETLLTDKFFAGEKQAWVDYMLWPIFERAAALPLFGEKKEKIAKIEAENYPNLSEWVEKMLEDTIVEKTRRSPELHARFLETLAAGKPNYDIE